MRMLALLAAVVAVVQGAAGAPGATVTSRAKGNRTSMALTVYNENLGLVRETRKLSLPSGVTEVRFTDVAAQIDPRTVHVKSLSGPGSMDVLEQNYEYDLISPDKLMERFLGREVTLVFEPQGAPGSQPREEKATLVSTNAGLVYEINGRYHINPPARPVLPELPGGLISSPTLVWLVTGGAGGANEVEATYLTGGLSWSADYVGLVGADDARMDLSGWVTMDNTSGATYEDARLKLVAGDVHRAAPPTPDVMQRLQVAAAEGAFQEEAFFEYHLYTLERPATLKDRQTKQISLMEAAGVPVQKIYLLAGQPHYYRDKQGVLGTGMKVAVNLELANTAKNGLGLPLPRGIVRLYKEDAGKSLQFIGEDRIEHTAKDEKITLRVGDAFDVVADRTQVDFRAVSAGRYDAEVEIRIAIRNHKEEEVKVTVREPVPGDWKVLSGSHPHTKPDSHTLEFLVPVPAGGEAILAYRVAVDWG